RAVFAGGRLVQTAKNVHEGGLAAARRSHDADIVAAVEVQRDTVHHFHGQGPHVVGLANVANAGHHLHVCCHRCARHVMQPASQIRATALLSSRGGSSITSSPGTTPSRIWMNCSEKLPTSTTRRSLRPLRTT